MKPVAQVRRHHLADAGAIVERLHLAQATVTCIPDLGNASWPVKALFSAAGEELLAAAAAGPAAGALDVEAGTMSLGFNIYLVQMDGLTMLVDAGIGSRKQRPDRPAWHDLDLPFLHVLAALGVKPDEVDVVVNTHLHADHVGWNTVLRGARWEPTFPRARYVVPRGEIERLRAAASAGSGGLLHGAYDDSVRPVLEAGLYEEVDLPHSLAPGLHLEAAPGHTADMAILRLVAGGQEVLFLADAIHHPLQFADPDLVSNFCADPVQARATRKRLFADAADSGAILAPCHFPGPVFGQLTRDAAPCRYRPLPVEDQAGRTEEPEENAPEENKT